MLKVFQSNYVESFLLIELIIYWKSKANSITYNKISLNCEEKSQTTLFIYCHAWQSRDMQLYFWRSFKKSC